MQAPQQLQDLMVYQANVSLLFDDGSISTSSAILGMHSSVLRGALDLSNSSEMTIIPMPGTKEAEWLHVAPFLYPLLPPAEISDWEQLEAVLKVSNKYDMQQLLHKADTYLISNTLRLDATASSPANIWKWLHLADACNLHGALPALAARAAAVDTAGCRAGSNLQGLSARALQQLVTVLAKGASHGSAARVQFCGRCRDHSNHSLSFTCGSCGHNSVSM